MLRGTIQHTQGVLVAYIHKATVGNMYVYEKIHYVSMSVYVQTIVHKWVTHCDYLNSVM